MNDRFDVAVIGTGTSAHHVVHAVAGAGRRVVVIDERPYGGTCAMRGCQPKKYLVAAAEAVGRAAHLQGIGLTAPPRIDWADLQRSKDEFVRAVPAGTESNFKRAGAEAVHGHAKFIGPDAILVGEREIRADRIVIATGAIPRPLGIPGEELLATSDGFLDLPELPGEIVFVGGGYISTEFAFVAAAAGAKVTILQRGDRILANFDADLVDELVLAASDLGIDIRTNSCVDRIERRGDRLGAACEVDPEAVVPGDLIVHGAGRVPNLDGLDLEAAGVERSARGVMVDEFLRSVSNPAVLAIGDAAATPYQLATTGDVEGKAAARTLTEAEPVAPDLTVVPSAVFTLPPLATVGLSEAEARASGRPIRVNRGDMTGWPSSRRIGQRHAAFKVIFDTETDEILGAHLLGHGMEEAINVFALAIRHGLTRRALRDTTWAYPTYVSDMKYTLG